MKRNANRSRPSEQRPIAWRDTEYAELRAGAAGRHEDRVSENIFDEEDERAEVSVIVEAMRHGDN